MRRNYEILISENISVRNAPDLERDTDRRSHGDSDSEDTELRYFLFAAIFKHRSESTKPENILKSTLRNIHCEECDGMF